LGDELREYRPDKGLYKWYYAIMKGI
jgi:hypothetical protein